MIFIIINLIIPSLPMFWSREDPGQFKEQLESWSDSLGFLMITVTFVIKMMMMTMMTTMMMVTMTTTMKTKTKTTFFGRLPGNRWGCLSQGKQPIAVPAWIEEHDHCESRLDIHDKCAMRMLKKCDKNMTNVRYFGDWYFRKTDNKHCAC